MNRYSQCFIPKYLILYNKSKCIQESPRKNLIAPFDDYIFFFGDFELQKVPLCEVISGYKERGYELVKIKPNCLKYKICFKSISITLQVQYNYSIIYRHINRHHKSIRCYFIINEGITSSSMIILYPQCMNNKFDYPLLFVNLNKNELPLLVRSDAQRFTIYAEQTNLKP